MWPQVHGQHGPLLCLGCRRTLRLKPFATWRSVLPHAQRFMASNPAGCCLHIVLSDLNVKTGDVAHCLEYAEQQRHSKCIDMARRLLDMSRTQRLKIARAA